MISDSQKKSTFGTASTGPAIALRLAVSILEMSAWALKQLRTPVTRKLQLTDTLLPRSTDRHRSLALLLYLPVLQLTPDCLLQIIPTNRICHLQVKIALLL